MNQENSIDYDPFTIGGEGQQARAKKRKEPINDADLREALGVAAEMDERIATLIGRKPE